MKLVSHFIFSLTAADLQVLAGVLNNRAELHNENKVLLGVEKVFLHEEYNEISLENDIAIIKVGLFFKYETQIQGDARYVIPLIVHNTILFLKKHLTSGTELILIGWKFFSNESL